MPVENFIPPIDSPNAFLAMANLSPDAASLHIVDQAREMTNSPSPLAMLLSDPEALEGVSHRHHTKRVHRSRSPRKDHKSMNTLLYELVGEEERQALNLKSTLNTVSDRLQQEINRANQANERASYAEARAMEFCSRAAVAESSLALAEREIAALKAEVESYKSQLRLAREDMARTKADALRLEDERNDANASLMHARDVAREYVELVREYEDRDASVEEEHRMNLQRWYDEGQERGWQEGHEAGYQKGRRRGLSEGKQDGLRAGREKGRKEERKSALLAFDDFLATQTYGPDDKLAEMVRKWRVSVYPTSMPDMRAPTPISQLADSWRDEDSETDSSISWG